MSAYELCTQGKEYNAQWDNIVIAMFGIPLLILALLGNFYSMGFFIKENDYGRGFSMIIVALAVFDNLTLIAAPARYMMLNILNCDIRWINVTICKISFFNVYFNKTMSLLLQVWLIVDRYVIIKYVMHVNIIYTVQIKLFVFFTCLAYALFKNIGLLLMPRMPVTGDIETGDRTNPCASIKNHPYHDLLYQTIMVHDVILTFSAGFLIIAFNILVSLYVRNSVNATETSKRTINYIVALGFLNTIMYLPSSINEAMELGDDSQQSNPTRAQKIQYIVINYISYMSHGVNVILYIIMSQKFRTSIISLLTFRRNISKKLTRVISQQTEIHSKIDSY